jgi:glycosyltransferase involved in cell wall biosynthesis
MTGPLVSILVATYQHVEFIGEALDSALAQTYPNIEVIVADDGSTDGTAEIVESYARRHPGRITVLPRKVNTGIDGIYENCARALRAGHGKYLCFLEGDDAYLPRKVEKQVAWMEEDDRRVLCAVDVDVFDSATGAHLFYLSDRHPLRAGTGADAIVRGQFGPATVGTMVRAGAAPRHGWEPRLRLVFDWLFWIECVADGGSYGYVDSVEARYRLHANSMMRAAHFDQVRLEDQLTTLALVQARYPHLGAACRDGRALKLEQHAMLRVRRGDFAAARHLALEAVREKIGVRRLGLAMFTLLPHRQAKAFLRWYDASRKWAGAPHHSSSR